ncbi:MAG TPA: peptide-methionine (R)-S-oxide reductase MsrB [Candidatus Saccharimonadales bacterium]|nr:peptide-methionine (R)-S-oxide reductase MsrB [Candidatus Saccharimonadales bacterium]
MTDDDFKQKLTPEQYHVLRQKGTEAPGTGALLHNDKTGDYMCAACGQVVFKSDTKFESDMPGLVGWPAFSKAASEGAVKLQDDNSMGMRRIEIICSNCGSHLGHLFEGDPSSPTGQHFCINSTALDFEEES